MNYLISLNPPVVETIIQYSITGIGFYLIISAADILSKLLFTIYTKFLISDWSIAHKRKFPVIHSIVVNYLNPLKRYLYFPFITLFIDTARLIFNPYKILIYLGVIIFFGLLSDCFITLPSSCQMSIYIILLGIMIETYDNRKLEIARFIQYVSDNKFYYAIFMIYRSFWISNLIALLIYLLHFFNFEIINTYILDYLENSWLKKILISTWLGDLFTLYYNATVHKLDGHEDKWDQFAGNNTVIMPHKTTLSVFDPGLNRKGTGLWFFRNGIWRRYYSNSYHNFDMRVYHKPDFNSESVFVNAWPLPKCEGLYVKVYERLGKKFDYRPLEPKKWHHTTHKVFCKDIHGKFVETPFQLQKGIKEIK